MNIYHVLLSIILVASHCMQSAETLESHDPQQENFIIERSKIIGKYCNIHKLTIRPRASTEKVGLLNYTIINSKSDTAEIIELFINKEYRRNHLGTHLMLVAFNDAQKKGVKKVILIPRLKAIPFYERFGLRTIDVNLLVYMEFKFSRDGDPEKNLEHYYKQKAVAAKKKALSKNKCSVM